MLTLATSTPRLVVSIYYSWWLAATIYYLVQPKLYYNNFIVVTLFLRMCTLHKRTCHTKNRRTQHSPASLSSLHGASSFVSNNRFTTFRYTRKHLDGTSFLPNSHLPWLIFTNLTFTTDQIYNEKITNSADIIYFYFFFFYCMACQHSMQKASTQRHGQPALIDI